MCGIAGFVAAAPLTVRDHDALVRLNEELYHRGPDGSGVFCDMHAMLAMRRLSIIDCANGWQPLFNENKTLALVANGEVYNFVELRKSLESRGHRFRTGSDCETILHLYEDHGVDCVQHLRGMYAFALWDQPRQQLLLVRDRLGEKPLYLYEDGQRLTFCSELKALVRSGLVPLELDASAIDAYFHLDYVPDPATPLQGVRKLPAAHYLLVNTATWEVKQRRYWELEDAPPLDTDPVETIRAELDRVSELVLRADVPVGVALSGGLDSSGIAALMARKQRDIHAFSVGYAGQPPSDERADARALAQHLGMPWHEVELDPGEVVDFFPELVHWRDDPIADVSGHGYYAVARLAREHGVPVLLSGQGGDELFWGYGWVQQAVQASLAKDAYVRGATRRLRFKQEPPPPADFARNLYRWLRSTLCDNHVKRAARAATAAPADCLAFYELTPGYLHALEAMPRLYATDFAERLDGHRADALWRFPRPWPRVDLRLTRLIIDTYLRENGMVQGDRLSMVSHVEQRLPLVDYRLVETVVGLRKAHPDHALAGKHWLREAFRGLLPDWVLNRRKRGFTPPWHQWRGPLFERYGPWLEDGHLVNAGVLQPHAAHLFAAKGAAEAGLSLAYKALALEAWCRGLEHGVRQVPVGLRKAS